MVDLQWESIDTSFPALSLSELWQKAQIPEPEKSVVSKVVNVEPVIPPPPPPPPQQFPPCPATATLIIKQSAAVNTRKKKRILFL